jgi:hypothetical protein
MADVSVYRFARKIRKLVRLENVKRKGRTPNTNTRCATTSQRERERDREDLTYTIATD